MKTPLNISHCTLFIQTIHKSKFRTAINYRSPSKFSWKLVGNYFWKIINKYVKQRNAEIEQQQLLRLHNVLTIDKM